MDILKLDNRYKDKNYLKKEEDGLYSLVLDPKGGKMVRYGLSSEEGEYYFVDPSGGPMIYSQRPVPDNPNFFTERIFLDENKEVRFKIVENDISGNK